MIETAPIAPSSAPLGSFRGRCVDETLIYG